MASLPGNNIEIGRYETDFGLRAEAYLNYCELESKATGKDVYHAVVEIIDGRAGIDHTIQLLPIQNEDENAVVAGHYELSDAAKTEVLEMAQKVFDQIAKDTVEGEKLTPAQRLGAMYHTAEAMRDYQRDAENPIIQMLMASMTDDPVFGEDELPPGDGPSVIGGLLQ